jgi:hypothetical protein
MQAGRGRGWEARQHSAAFSRPDDGDEQRGIVNKVTGSLGLATLIILQLQGIELDPAKRRERLVMGREGMTGPLAWTSGCSAAATLAGPGIVSCTGTSEERNPFVPSTRGETEGPRPRQTTSAPSMNR